MPADDLTPAKAPRTLIDIEKRERARDERQAKIRAKIDAAVERLLNPFARRKTDAR